jgi:hypothetical protein
MIDFAGASGRWRELKVSRQASAVNGNFSRRLIVTPKSLKKRGIRFGSDPKCRSAFLMKKETLDFPDISVFHNAFAAQPKHSMYRRPLAGIYGPGTADFEGFRFPKRIQL